MRHDTVFDPLGVPPQIPGTQRERWGERMFFKGCVRVPFFQKLPATNSVIPGSRATPCPLGVQMFARMENQMENHVEQDMETAFIYGLCGHCIVAPKANVLDFRISKYFLIYRGPHHLSNVLFELEPSKWSQTINAIILDLPCPV